MSNIEQVAMRFPCCFLAREFHDASSPLDDLRERVTDDSLALLALEITAKADFGRVRLALAKEDKEGSGIRCFNFHGLVVR